MSAIEALGRLGQSTAEACLGVLEMFAPGQITPGEVVVVGADRHPLEGIPVPAVAMSVSYVDGVTGGITLYADKIPVHTGRPGRSGSRRAVQVTGHVGGSA